jgi:GH15 family glucan-1,4-alpha-glucosidase
MPRQPHRWSTVTAFVNLGYQREAAEFLRFLREADTSRGRDLHLARHCLGQPRRRGGDDAAGRAVRQQLQGQRAAQDRLAVYQREAAEFLRFLREADTSRGRDLHLMYALDGAVPGEEFLDHLCGWRGIGPVGIGNAAADQDPTGRGRPRGGPAGCGR